jgi:hypothetical protein
LLPHFVESECVPVAVIEQRPKELRTTGAVDLSENQLFEGLLLGCHSVSRQDLDTGNLDELLHSGSEQLEQERRYLVGNRNSN